MSRSYAALRSGIFKASLRRPKGEASKKKPASFCLPGLRDLGAPSAQLFLVRLPSDAGAMPPKSIQPVEIVDYDPKWVESFAVQRAKLTALLAPWLVGAVEHVGSTAVPGCGPSPWWICSPRFGHLLMHNGRYRCWNGTDGCIGRKTRTEHSACSSCARIPKLALITCT